MTGSSYATMVTQGYLDRRASAAAGGPAVNFVAGTLICGDGFGAVPSVDALLNANGVLHEVWRGQVIASVTVNEQTSSEIDIMCIIPATDGQGHEIGPFWIREFAITDETGAVMVVGTTQLEKTTGAQNGQVSDLSFIAAIGESNTSTVVLTPAAAGYATIVDVVNIINQKVIGTTEPLYTSEAVGLDGHVLSKYAVRIAPQDVTKLGVTRPATDAEFASFTPDPASLTQFPYPTLQQIQSVLSSLSTSLLYAGVETGTANAYAIPTTKPVIHAYERGVTVIFLPGNDSTGGECTLNLGGLGNVALKGFDGNQTVGKKHLAAGMPAIAWHDGTRFRLVYSSGMNPQSTKWWVGTASGVSPNALTIAFSGPSPAARTVSINIRAKIASGPNTGPVTVNYGFGAIPVVLNDGGAVLSGGEMPLNYEAILFDDGTNLRLVNPHVAPVVIPPGPADGALVHRGTAGGSANTIATTLTPAVMSGARGFLVELKITANNTAAVTVNYGEGDVSVIDNVTGAPLVGGELKKDSIATLWLEQVGVGPPQLRLMNTAAFRVIPPPYEIGTIIWGSYAFGGLALIDSHQPGATGTIPGLPGTWRCHGVHWLTYTGDQYGAEAGAQQQSFMSTMVRIA